MRSRLAYALAVLSLSAPIFAASPAPELTQAFFAGHRQKFAAKLPEGAIAIVRTAPETSVETSPDPYRQDSDFWYLTGFSEADGVALIRPGAPEGQRYVLFVAPKDLAKEQWTGWRAGVDGAKKDFGAEQSYSAEEFWKKLPELALGAKALYYSDGDDSGFRDKLLQAWNAGNANATAPRPIAEAGPIVHQQRLIKDATEIALLRRAAELSIGVARAFAAQAKSVERIVFCLYDDAALAAFERAFAEG